MTGTEYHRDLKQIAELIMAAMVVGGVLSWSFALVFFFVRGAAFPLAVVALLSPVASPVLCYVYWLWRDHCRASK